MTAAEHRSDAERGIGYAQKSDSGTDEERFHLGLAQVHALLAIAYLLETIADALEESR